VTSILLFEMNELLAANAHTFLVPAVGSTRRVIYVLNAPPSQPCRELQTSVSTPAYFSKVSS